jgi:uncharacterized membrane protein (DUF106 family)
MKKVYEIQNTIKEKTDKLTQLSKIPTTPKAELDALQKEIMSLMPEVMRHQMKPLLVLLPLFVIIYYVLLPFFFASSAANLKFTSFNLTYQLLFFYVSLIFGLIVSLTITAYDKRKMKKEKAQVQVVQQ